MFKFLWFSILLLSIILSSNIFSDNIVASHTIGNETVEHSNETVTNENQTITDNGNYTYSLDTNSTITLTNQTNTSGSTATETTIEPTITYTMLNSNETNTNTSNSTTTISIQTNTSVSTNATTLIQPTNTISSTATTTTKNQTTTVSPTATITTKNQITTVSPTATITTKNQTTTVTIEVLSQNTVNVNIVNAYILDIENNELVMILTASKSQLASDQLEILDSFNEDLSEKIIAVFGKQFSVSQVTDLVYRLSTASRKRDTSSEEVNVDFTIKIKSNDNSLDRQKLVANVLNVLQTEKLSLPDGVESITANPNAIVKSSSGVQTKIEKYFITIFMLFYVFKSF